MIWDNLPDNRRGEVWVALALYQYEHYGETLTLPQDPPPTPVIYAPSLDEPDPEYVREMQQRPEHLRRVV